MNDDEAAGNFPPPDAGGEIADEPDPAFDETDDEDGETPTDDEPDVEAAEA
jgi:hypothetical protein